MKFFFDLYYLKGIEIVISLAERGPIPMKSYLFMAESDKIEEHDINSDKKSDPIQC